MKARFYNLIEDVNCRYKIVELDELGKHARYLIGSTCFYKVVHTLIIDDPTTPEKAVQELIDDCFDRYQLMLHGCNTTAIDTGEDLFIFFYEDIEPLWIFGEHQNG